MKKMLTFPVITSLFVVFCVSMALYSKFYVVSPARQFVETTFPQIIADWDATYVDSLMIPDMDHAALPAAMNQLKQGFGKCEMGSLKWLRRFNHQIGVVNVFMVRVQCEQTKGIAKIEVNKNDQYGFRYVHIYMEEE